MTVARRNFIRAAAIAATPLIPPARLLAAPAAAPTTTRAPSQPLRMLQCMDPAPDQQEHVRDFAAGLQLALTSARRAGATAVQAVQMECDGSAASVAAVGRRLADDGSLLALVGTTTERASIACLQQLDAVAGPIAHVAPWLPDSRLDHLAPVANVFASRVEQLRQTIVALKAMGLIQLGIVFESASARDFLEPTLTPALRAVQMKAPMWAPAPGASIERLVASLPPDAPAVLGFAGGAIELSRFMRALALRSFNRIVLSLTSVDLGLLQQLGAARDQALVLTQTVPNPTRASMPLVRQFRDAHARLFDDTPTPSSLAGYIAGRYALHLADRLPASPTRQNLLDEVRRRQSVDMDGYALHFPQGRNRGSQYVALTMLTREGRLIG